MGNQRSMLPSAEQRHGETSTLGNAIAWFSLALLVPINCGPAAEPEPKLVVFAASSLIAPLQEIGADFEAEQGIEVEFNFASSSLLAKQIEQNAAVDAFISASPVWTDYLLQKGFIGETPVMTIARNRLIVIAPAASGNIPQRLDDLLLSEFHPIAVGDPTHVPVGMYAQDMLERAGYWEVIQSKILPALDAMATVATVGRGEAPCGISYQSDVYQRPHVQLAFTFPERFQPDIFYTCAVPKSSKTPALAAKFSDYLLAPKAQRILAKFQFQPIN